MRRVRTFLRPVGDDGFSLLESVIALAIAAIVFTALGAATISSVKAVLVGRTVQQAGDVAEQALEAMRSVGYDAAAMQTTDLGGERAAEPGRLLLLRPDRNTVTGSGTEPLVSMRPGSISPHVDDDPRELDGLHGPPLRDPARGRNRRATSGSPSSSTWTTRTETRTRILSSLITRQAQRSPAPRLQVHAQWGDLGLRLARWPGRCSASA